MSWQGVCARCITRDSTPPIVMFDLKCELRATEGDAATQQPIAEPDGPRSRPSADRRALRRPRETIGWMR